MKQTKTSGVYQFQNRLFTINPPACNGVQVYNERCKVMHRVEYRTWNPHRSKLAAFLQKRQSLEFSPNFHILYLGAATGTTVSHVSDIVSQGMVYAIEHSAVSMKDLIEVTKTRKNILPLLMDANHPDRYSIFVPPVDFVYQDISQRNQGEIFLRNCQRFLKPDHYALLMVKARSIDVSVQPKKVYDMVAQFLEDNGYPVQSIVDLNPFEKDHAALLVKKT